MATEARILELEAKGASLMQSESEHLIKRLYDDYISGDWFSKTMLSPRAAKEKIVEQFGILSSIAVQRICDKIK